MPNIKIKQLDERVATSGIHFGGPATRRKLMPGEVVEITDDMAFEDGSNMLDALMATGKIELTMEAVNRPLDFANEREATLTMPTFRLRGEDDERAVAAAKAAVAERLRPAPEVREAVDVEPMETATPARRGRRRAAGNES